MMKGGYMIPNTKLYYMLPDENSVKENKQAIQSTLNNNTTE